MSSGLKFFKSQIAYSDFKAKITNETLSKIAYDITRKENEILTLEIKLLKRANSNLRSKVKCLEQKLEERDFAKVVQRQNQNIQNNRLTKGD